MTKERVLLIWLRNGNSKKSNNQNSQQPQEVEGQFSGEDIIEPCHEKTCLMPYANKGAGQPAHTRSLSRAFVVCCLDSIKLILTKSKISRLWLVSVAEQAGLSLTCS